MKKIKALLLLIYTAFGLLIVHDALPGATRGFMDGLRDGANEAHGQPSQSHAIPAVLYGDMLTRHNNMLKINNDYTLQNIYINADVVISNEAATSPLLIGLSITLVFGIAVLLILLAVNINRVIISIANGQMFESSCIRYLTRIGVLLLSYAIADVVYQRLKIAVLRSAIHDPLQVYNTTSFNFQVLICAILAFIIAEAFKHGARLQAEQDLTI